MLLTPDQVAEKLQICRETLRRWAKEGKGPPCVQVAQTIRYRREDVDGWISSLLPSPATERRLVIGNLMDLVDEPTPGFPTKNNAT